MTVALETERLRLRPWEIRDLAPFAALGADPEVMRYFPRPLSRDESDALVTRLEGRWRDDGIAFVVAERKADAAFIGMVGLSRVRFGADSPVTGAVEVGWRLARAHWGRGYATEAARGWLAHGFDTMGLAEIVAFTVPANLRSQAVMERLGMRPDPKRNFDHPGLSEGHPLRPHRVFALDRATWATGRRTPGTPGRPRVTLPSRTPPPPLGHEWVRPEPDPVAPAPTRDPMPERVRPEPDPVAPAPARGWHGG